MCGTTSDRERSDAKKVDEADFYCPVDSATLPSLLRGRLHDPSPVAVNTDVVLLAGGRRTVRMARLLAA